MASDHVTCSLRVPRHEALRTVAYLRGVSVAEQARAFVLDGLRKALDPVEIERLYESREAAPARRSLRAHRHQGETR